MSVWIGIAFAVVLLLLGLGGLGIGMLLVIQQLRRRQTNQTWRKKKIEEIRRLPTRNTEVYPSSQRPTMPLMASPAAQQAAQSNPTLEPEEDPDVPTAVFRPSQFSDIDALLKEADKYVDKHKK